MQETESIGHIRSFWCLFLSQKRLSSRKNDYVQHLTKGLEGRGIRIDGRGLSIMGIHLDRTAASREWQPGGTPMND